MLLSALDPIRLFLLPPLLMLISTFSLLSFQSLLVFVSRADKLVAGNEILKYLKPVIKNFNRVVATVFGKAESLKFNATHVLLMCVVIAVIALAGTIYDAEARRRESAEKKK